MAFAYLAWVSPAKNRAHKRLDGYMSISYQEIHERFGRGKFKPLNDRLAIFEGPEKSPDQWWSDEGHTKAYKLKEDIERAVSDYLPGWRRRMRKVDRALVGMDGKHLHEVPQAIASKDTNGVTAKAWNRAKVKNLIPVDVPRLAQYSKQLERMINDKQRDLFVSGDVADYEYRIAVMGRIMGMAREEGGRWCVMQRYVESDSGRLYGKNINLATAPRSVKEVALHGMWEYDFANCHYAILHQLAIEDGIDCPAIRNYLEHKRLVRKQLMEDIGLTIDDAKTCLIALIYGARFSRRDEDAIPDAIGKEAALRLYQHPIFKALKDEVVGVGNQIIRGWPKKRKSFINAYGKGLKEAGDPKNRKTPPTNPQILAHLLQGVEAKMLEAVRRLYPDEIQLLQHDGFASSVRLDTGRIAQAIAAATGYRMVIEESQIALSPNLGID